MILSLIKLLKKLKGWKEKHLSFVRRGILIKAVAQTIPTYIMSVFLLPKNLCHHLEKIICDFWWGSTTGLKKMHWIKWSKLCKAKKDGGMGFRDLRAFNEALLSKQSWRIQTQQNSLMAKVLKAKYFSHSTFYEAKVKPGISYSWRNILHSRWILKKCCFWTIGNGTTIDIWKDNWLPFQNGFKILSKEPSNNTLVKISDLIDPNTKDWNISILNTTFMPIEAQQISQIPLTNTTEEDDIVCAGINHGDYIVKSVYCAIKTWEEQTSDNPSNSATLSNPI